MLDRAPRVLTVQDVNMLCNFAELAVRELEKQQVVCSNLHKAVSDCVSFYKPCHVDTAHLKVDIVNTTACCCLHASYMSQLEQGQLCCSSQALIISPFMHRGWRNMLDDAQVPACSG